MKQTFKSKNTIALFSSLNQGAEKETVYYCSLFAPAINLKYNCGIELTIEDLKAIGKKQIALGKLDPRIGGTGIDGINAVYNYVVENAEKRKWIIPKLIRFKKSDDLLVKDWLDRGYAIIIGISVNKDFVKDSIDGKLDMFENYLKYKGNDLKHFTNIMRWKARFLEKGGNYNKEYILDSYAFNKQGKKWDYECNIKEVLEDLTMETKYLFY